MPTKIIHRAGGVMRLHCEFSTPVIRTELDDYIRHLEISIGCYDEEGVNEYIIGRLAMDQILWADALVDGESLFEICDNDSQGLHEVHTILTKGKQEFRSDLKIREPVDHVIFLYGVVIHPSIHPWRQGVFDAAFRIFGEMSLAVMWKDTSGLTESELADLGFCKVAGSDLIFRHSAVRTPFSDEHPAGQDADVAAQPEYEEWVEQQWKRFTGPAGD